MKLLKVIFCTFPFTLVAAPIYADDSASEDEVTIEVVGEAEAQPEGLTDTISLPEEAAEQAHESAAFGLETANRAREKGEDFGREQAEEARENGRINGGFDSDTSVEAQATGDLGGASVETEIDGSADVGLNR